MQSEKLDILADKRRQQGQLLKMLTIYCRRHRLMDFNLGALSPVAMDAIGNEIVDLFVDRIQRGKKKTPPKTGRKRPSQCLATKGEHGVSEARTVVSPQLGFRPSAGDVFPMGPSKHLLLNQSPSRGWLFPGAFCCTTPLAVGQFGFERAIDRLGKGIVVGAANASDRRLDASLKHPAQLPIAIAPSVNNGASNRSKTRHTTVNPVDGFVGRS